MWKGLARVTFSLLKILAEIKKTILDTMLYILIDVILRKIFFNCEFLALSLRSMLKKERIRYILESAGESGGLMVSGLMQSEGDGERSRLVTGAWRPSASPAPPPNAEPPRCVPPSASPGMPFSDRNSSKSTYCNRQYNSVTHTEPAGINARRAWRYTTTYRMHVRSIGCLLKQSQVANSLAISLIVYQHWIHRLTFVIYCDHKTKLFSA